MTMVLESDRQSLFFYLAREPVLVVGLCESGGWGGGEGGDYGGCWWVWWVKLSYVDENLGWMEHIVIKKKYLG